MVATSYIFILDLCPPGDLNPHDLSHWYLKPARLPIPPGGRICNSKQRLNMSSLNPSIAGQFDWCAGPYCRPFAAFPAVAGL